MIICPLCRDILSPISGVDSDDFRDIWHQGCDILPPGYEDLPPEYKYYDPVAIYHGGGRILYDSLTTRHLVQV